MRASSKAYEDVACHCSEYLPVQKDNVSNCSNCDRNLVLLAVTLIRIRVSARLIYMTVS